MDLTGLHTLINIDSPSGFHHKACEWVFAQLEGLGYAPRYTQKGAVVCQVGAAGAPTLAMAAHVDTLGTMVSGINTDGTLRFTTIGGLQLNSAEGEYVRVYTLDGRVYTGTILMNNPASHVNKELSGKRREATDMHIRLDESVANEEDVAELGVRVGDYGCLDPRYQELSSGYVKSRFLDNKVSCHILLELARSLAGQQDSPGIELFFSNYEEVGHGAAAGFSDSIEELLVLDMAVVGENCTGDEKKVSICAKDSTGPYDYNFRKLLVELAEANDVDHVIDVYPFYGSDGSAALSAGHEFRVGLIGPGVAASHGNERTHKDGIQATLDLVMAYVAFATLKKLNRG